MVEADDKTVDDDDDDSDAADSDNENVDEPVPETQRRDESQIAYSPIFNKEELVEVEVEDSSAGIFNETDFDDQFDDDFEEEIEGEYELEDDHYGEEFAEVEEAMGMKKAAKKDDDEKKKKKK